MQCVTSVLQCEPCFQVVPYDEVEDDDDDEFTDNSETEPDDSDLLTDPEDCLEVYIFIVYQRSLVQIIQ